MNNQERAIKLAEILENAEIMEKISIAESKEVMQNVFSENGLELTMSEVDSFIQMMNSNNSDEISEESLDSVSGGAVDAVWIFSTAYKGVKAVAKTCWNAGKWVAKNIG